MAPLQIGVMMEMVQLSDIACIDVLGNLNPGYLETVAQFGGADDLKSLGVEMTFHYIATTLEPAFMTPSVKINPTVTYDDAPRDLDILLIGGPPPNHRPAQSIKFLKEAAEKTKIIMTTCIGSLWLASAGVLDGKKATTNRGALGMAKQFFPQVEWVDQRWVVDGKLWTAGGAGAGIDMVATYALQTFPEKAVKFGLEGLDYDPSVRGQFYQ
ncbi:MAG: hypothetical protein M1837_001400 [Sclerophora amabilis]|nr:MAG: hypothetical protein M1837_001400 [Sclerophora amabilis]